MQNKTIFFKKLAKILSFLFKTHFNSQAKKREIRADFILLFFLPKNIAEALSSP